MMSWIVAIVLITVWTLLTWIVARETQRFLNNRPPGITPEMLSEAFSDAIDGRCSVTLGDRRRTTMNILEEPLARPQHATYEECMAIYEFKHGAIVPGWQWMGFFGPNGIAVVRTIPNGWAGVPPTVMTPSYILADTSEYGEVGNDKYGWWGFLEKANQLGQVDAGFDKIMD